jgi:GNAT superfamily N-acetyltransferase
MKFEINPELVDQIIFGMENQEEELLFDTKESNLVPLDEVDEDPADPDRYITLPPWQSVHGFNLMERFVATLRNPIYRELLRGILASGRGVFRQFKNALKDRKEMERLWYRFKEREMRKEVLAWYNTLRESWGLEEVELDFEETEDLILSDFILERWHDPEDDLIVGYDRKGFFEIFPDELDLRKEGMYQSRRYGYLPSDPLSIVYRASTPTGEPAGFLWAVQNHFRTDIASLHVLQVYVMPEYRGLGLAKTLFHYFCEKSAKEDCRRISIELMGESLQLSKMCKDEGFVPFSEVLELDIEKWQPPAD